MYYAFLVIRLLPSNNGMKIQLLIHVVMNSKGTKMNMLSFQEVVVGIGANVEFTQQPAHAKFMMMFLDEPISL